MTRLLQWLLSFSLFFSVWVAVCLEHKRLGLPSSCYSVVIALPVYLLICFGCYSLMVVGYRVYKFNDCVEAAEELKQQITEAREDLQKKGFQFD